MCANLIVLQINHNQISSWSDLDVLKSKSELQTVYLEGNPIASDPQYKHRVLEVLPNLMQLDWETLRS
jgi:hypothetical protein